MDFKKTALSAAAALALGYGAENLAEGKGKKYEQPNVPTRAQLEKSFKQRALNLKPLCDKKAKSYNEPVCTTGLRLLDADMNRLPADSFVFVKTEAFKDANGNNLEIRDYMLDSGKTRPNTALIAGITAANKSPAGPVEVSDNYVKQRWIYTQWADLFRSLGLNRNSTKDAVDLMIFNYAVADNPIHKRTFNSEQLVPIYTLGGDIWDVVSGVRKDTRGRSLNTLLELGQWAKFEKGRKAKKFYHLVIPQFMTVRVPNSYILGMYDSGKWTVSQNVTDFMNSQKDKKDKKNKGDKKKKSICKAENIFSAGFTLGYLNSDYLPNRGATYFAIDLRLAPKVLKGNAIGLDFLVGKTSDSYTAAPNTFHPNPQDPFALYGWTQSSFENSTALFDILFAADIKLSNTTYLLLGVGPGFNFASSKESIVEQLKFPNGDIADESHRVNPVAHDTSAYLSAKLGLKFKLTGKKGRGLYGQVEARLRTNGERTDVGGGAGLDYRF